MAEKITVDSLSPLQCQLIVLIGLLREYLPWHALREALRASCGSARPDDAALDATYRELVANGVLRTITNNGSTMVIVSKPPSGSLARKRAAAVFGPIDIQAAKAMMIQSCPELAKEMDEYGNSGARDAVRYLEYLKDILDGERFAAHLDAAAEAFGLWPSEYDYGIRGEGLAQIVCNWPAPIPSPIAELRLPWELDAAFKNGRPAGAILEALAAAMPRHAALRCGIAARCLAPLLVWAGRGDLLALCEGARPKRNGGDTEPADDDALAAVAFARGFFGKVRKNAVAGAGKLFDNGIIAQKALLALNAAKFPPPKPTLMQAMAEISGRSRSSWEWGKKLLLTPDKAALRLFLAGAESAWVNDDEILLERIPSGIPPLAWLGRTMAHALSKDAAMRTSFPEAPQALAAAERAAADGWTFLAAQMGGLLAQYPEVAERALALAAAAPADEPLLWSRTETAKPWDPILDRLGEALSGFQRATRTAAPPKAKAAAEMLVADLSLHSPQVADGGRSGDASAYHLRVIEPALAKRRRDGGFSRPDNACTWRALRKALVALSAGLSRETTVALDAWMRREQPHYGNEYHAMEITGPGRESLLEILLGAGGDASLRVLVGANAVEDPEIEIHDLELVTKDNPDGSFTVSLPALAWLAENNPLLVREEPSRFIWWRMPDKLRPFYDLLRKEGEGENGHELHVPAGGAAKARAMLLEAAKAGLPVRGAITPAGEGSALSRVAGSARLVARLDRRDGSLRLLLRARPVQTEPELLFQPGRGKAEIVVTSTKKPFMLVRDRAAESSAADAVRDALSDFDDEREGENEWIAEGEERELALLEALRAMPGVAPAGFDVEWRALPRERTKVNEVSSVNLEGSKGADWWLGVTGEFQLDDGERVALRDLIAALPRRVGGYIPLGERAWVRLSAELRRRLDALAAAGSLRGNEVRVSRAALPMLEAAFAKDGQPAAGDGATPALPALPSVLSEAAARISAALAETHPVPEGLTARLRPYQGEGYEWLARLAACGLGGCLADDMGLGKTIQLLALLLSRAGDGPSLVVAPASVCGNWCAEAARFAPGLRVVRASDSATLPQKLEAGDLVVASYGILTSRIGQFAGVAWNGAVLDEAQAIKNADTQRAEAVKRLRAAWRFVATGTPVENRLSDLWSIFDFLNPGLLGTLDEFRARLLDHDGRPLSALRTLVRPLVLRRLKGEVLRDLPPKTEITLTVEPDERERAAYEALREEELEAIHEGDKGVRMKILAALMRLRRFCCSPSLAVAGLGTGAKLEALESLLGDLRENGHRALVFSQFTDVLALVKPILERNGWGCEYLDGSTPQKERMRRVEAFQHGSAPFFLVSLKAGGTGLNLTAANYVVLLDPWWNPAVEDQAADRAHRIGQHNPVTVYRLVVRGTVEEKVVALHGEKRALASAVLDGTSDAALSETDLMALLKGGADDGMPAALK